ncbi:zinc-dependent metalloprotease [Pedobacter sp. UBA4863]|uniref:zinc-dependent metalloprotease n=1 Tax=Pedobacter sp. UBA4863 TaxID=1947060 RepID=UPI0025F571CD|nr:zinc-dependent metalloprotease [Pedobacter sp. UBA4863]
MITKNQTLLAVFACCSIMASTTYAQTPKTTPPTTTAATNVPPAPKKESIKSFSEIVTAKAQSKKGLFNTHKVDDKWFFEIPDTILNREMLVVTRLVKVPAGLKVSNQQYAGELLNEMVWTWERRGKQIYIRVPSYAISVDKNSDMYESVKNSNLSGILAAFDIKAYNKDSTGVLIDVSDFYNGDIPAIGLSDNLKKAYKASAIDATKSYLDSIRTYPLNLEVGSVKTYRAAESPIDNSIGSITVALNTSMLLLPKTPVKPRLMDPRVGYFGQSQTDYSLNDHKVERTNYIRRWNLIPKDTAAYMRGELVAPTKPITIYIDPATPKKWVPYLIKGINDWQMAFEAAGFKEAIFGKEAPTPAQDPEFSLEDSRYSVIRYFPSNKANAYGPHIADPRTGQILETHIGWYHNVMSLLKNWFLIQTGAVNTEARKLKLSEEQMGELIRIISSHEVGHTLGLPHNFGSSAAYPVDSLRSKTFTAKNGTAPSIMDYARFNYIAQPGDGVTNVLPSIGPYDKWAIKWGYTWFPGGLNAQQEKEKLDVWTRERSKNPIYFYGSQSSIHDPRSQAEDLGDDPIKASMYGIMNLKRILPNLQKWTFENGKDFSGLRETYYELIAQFARYMGHVVANIGGVNETYKTYGENGTAFSHIQKQKQQEAVAFLNQQLFSTPNWLIRNELLDKFDNGLLITRIKSTQTNIINSIILPAKLAKLLDNEARNGAKAYTLTDLYNDLRAGIFTLAAPDDVKRNLQRSYVERLGGLMLEGYKYTPGDATLSDMVPLTRLELKKIAALAKTRSAIGNETTKAHYQELEVKINNLLNPKK